MPSACERLGSGEALWVSGPARVEVAEGCVLVSGLERCSGDAVVVGAERGASFAAREPARLCLVPGSGAAWAKVKWDPGPWLRVVESLEREAAERVVVLGAPETGKSSITTWIVNMLGLPVVEADIGQNELGLPGCVAYADPGEASSLQDLEPRGCRFVGHVSAERVMDLVVAAAAAAASSLGRYVMDTDGFVDARGLFYKSALLAALGPDAAIIMGGRSDLRTAAALYAAVVFEAPPPPLPRERSRLDRRSYRSRAWARLLSSDETVALEAPVLGLCSHSETEAGLLYTCPGGLRIAVQPRPPPRGAVDAWLRPGWERGLLAAAMEPQGDTPVVVERLDPHSGRVIVRALRLPWQPPRRPAAVRLGWIRLGENYEEEHIRPGLLPGALVTASRGRRRR